MTDNTLPEVGSRWTINGSLFTVAAVKKRGRGYYVESEEKVEMLRDPGVSVLITGRERLADFRKQAKPA